MPRSANITMNRKSRSNKLAIERILFNSDATRLRRDDQYLKEKQGIYFSAEDITEVEF